MENLYFDLSRPCDKFSPSTPPAFPFRAGFKQPLLDASRGLPLSPLPRTMVRGFIALHTYNSFYSFRNHMKGGDKRIGHLTEEETAYRSFIQESLLNLANEKVKSERRIVMKRFWNFVKDENGLETVEYAIIAGLITVASIAIISGIGTQVAAVFQELLDRLNTVPTGS